MLFFANVLKTGGSGSPPISDLPTDLNNVFIELQKLGGPFYTITHREQLTLA
jgi:hypothetical protein